jgi:hypothetical protein
MASMLIGYKLGQRDQKIKLLAESNQQIRTVQSQHTSLPEPPAPPPPTPISIKPKPKEKTAAQKLKEATEQKHNALKSSFEACVLGNITRGLYTFEHNEGIYKNVPENLIQKALAESLKELRAGNPHLDIACSIKYDRYNMKHYASVVIKGS